MLHLSSLSPLQDYGWFLAGLCWLAIGVGAIRAGKTLVGWRWLSWVAMAGSTRAAIELVSYAWPVVPEPHVAPYLWVEHGLAICDGLVLIGVLSCFWHLRSRVLAALRAGGCLALAFESSQDGWYGPAVMLLAVVALAITAGWRKSEAGLRRAILWTVVSVVSTSHGSLAMLVGPARRWIELTPWSGWWAAGQTAAAIAIIGELIRVALPTRAARAEWLPFARVGAVWLAIGLGVAAVTGSGARRVFEASAMARASMASGLMDRAMVAKLFNPDFQIERVETWRQPSGLITYFGHAPRLDSAAARLVRQQLVVINQANPDVPWVMLQTWRGEWLVNVMDADYPLPSATVVGLEQSTSSAIADWVAAKTSFLRPEGELEGTIGARAPVFAPGGELVAWLIFGFETNQWIASQAQARLQTYAIVALGLGLAALVVAQRIRTREREAARRSASEAAAADRLKTAFLAKVSHELRTPIQSILGYGELLDGVVQDRVGRERLGALRQHGRLMLRLVNDLLDLEALRTGAFRLVNRPTQVQAMFRQTIDSLRPRAEAKGLILRYGEEGTFSAWVSCDVERLRQVAINLVTNAIKFTQVGEITVTIAEEEPGDWVLQVRDTGPGISREDLGQLFKPFSRLELAVGEEGSGLGLALAAGLCVSMAGGIAVESELGHGSTFRASFRLPPVAAPAGEERTEDARVSLAGRRILVADDNALVRELFEAMLVEAGAQVMAVGDGEEALAMAELRGFDGIVMDVAMPNLDGLAATQQLRHRGVHSRIVVVSAHAGGVEREQALASGADVFLTKPVESWDLCRALVAEPVRRPDKATAEDALRLRLAARFREEVGPEWSAIEGAVRAEDFAGLRRSAHYLRNSASVVQDEALMSACGRIEAWASGDGTDVDGLRILLDRCRSDLRRWLPTQSPGGLSEPPAT